MRPALNIPGLVSPPCLSLPHTFPSAIAKQRHERYHLPMELFNNTFPFTLSLPIPLPSLHFLPLPLPFPLPILCSLSFPGLFLTAVHDFLTLPVVIVIAIARTASSTARRSGIKSGFILIDLVDYLIPIQWAKTRKSPGL